MTTHNHDWRVDPNQVILMVGVSARVCLACAACSASAIAYSMPMPAIDQVNRSTWRAFVPRRGDRIIHTMREDGSLRGAESARFPTV